MTEMMCSYSNIVNVYFKTEIIRGTKLKSQTFN